MPTGTTPAQDAQQITAAFLTAWKDGDIAQAAGYTDAPTAARAALATYGKDLGLRRFSVAYQSDTAITVRPAAGSSLSPSARAPGAGAAAAYAP